MRAPQSPGTTFSRTVFRSGAFLSHLEEAGPIGGIPTNPHLRAFLVTGLVGALLLAGLAWTPSASGARNVSALLVEESGSTDMLGGGDYVFVRFGLDAAFGVLWGNATHPNDVYLVAIKARYLGVGQVYDTTGRQILTNYPVRYWTLYALRLDNLVEFRDNDGDGIADYRRAWNATSGEFDWYSPDGDAVEKRADLNATWSRGNITRSSTATSRSWEFNLTATNLPYVAVNGTVPPGAVLDRVRFGFHLNASLEEIENVTVPNWRITIDTSRPRDLVQNVTRLENATFSGKVARYNLKWDQEIVGWDFGGGANRRLLLEFWALVGNLIPPAAANWLDRQFVSRQGDDGAARYESVAGSRTLDNRTGDLGTADRVRTTSPYLEFGGNWSRVGRLTWVTDSTVDGVTQPLYAQVLAARGIVTRGEAGGAYVGFVLLGGLSYARGATIQHDPEFATDVIAELTVPVDEGARVLIAVGVAVAVILVGLLAFVLTRKKKPETQPPAKP